MANATLRWGIGSSAPANRNLLDHIRNQKAIWVPGEGFAYSQIVKYSNFSAAATTESLDLNATFTSNLFPAYVCKGIAWLEVLEAFTDGGVNVTAATMILGDAGDDNGLVTQVSVFTIPTGAIHCPGGAEVNSGVMESAYVPLLQLDTTGANISTLTTGKVRVNIVYKPLRAMGG